MTESGKRYGQEGALVSIVAIIILAIGLISASGFAFWAYNGRQDYKNNSDKKVAAAVSSAVSQEKDKLQKQFDEQAKLPVLTFTGPLTYGSVTFNYPRTWNGYVDQNDASNPLKAYFANGLVPAQSTGSSAGVNYALRVDLVSMDYSQVLTSFAQALKKGVLTASAYVPPQMVGKPNVQTSTRLDGQIENSSQNNPIQGSMVVLKVRDKTLKIYTESPSFLSDFNNTILASLTYVP